VEKFPSIVADIMSSPAITLDGEFNVRDAAILMTDKEIGSIIVMERNQPIGIVTEEDILKKIVVPCKDPCLVKIREIMSTPLITVPKETTILEAMRELKSKRISRLVVMNDTIQGIVSERDITRACAIASLTSFPRTR